MGAYSPPVLALSLEGWPISGAVSAGAGLGTILFGEGLRLEHVEAASEEAVKQTELVKCVNYIAFNTGPFSFLHAIFLLIRLGISSPFQITDSNRKRPELIHNVLHTLHEVNVTLVT